jgi:hypothetical protein
VKTKSDCSQKKHQAHEKGLVEDSRQHLDGNADFSSPLHPNSHPPGKHGPNEGEVPHKHTSPCFTSSPSEPQFLLLALGPAQYPFRQWVPANGRVITGSFSLDTETERIDEN